MHERLEQLLQLHSMCSQELHQLQRNVENYLRSSDKILTMMQNNWHEVERGNGLTVMIYDNFVTSITNIMNYARKLNLQLLLNYSRTDNEESNVFGSFEIQSEQKHSESGQENDSNTQACGTNELVNGDVNKQAQNLFPAEEIYVAKATSDDFVYPKLKLTECYKIGSVFRAYVTYIKCLDELQFYVVDPQSESSKNMSEVSQSLNLYQYHTLPPANEVFGLVLDKRILRAVRSTKVLYDQEQDEEVWPCYLLDFGETVNIKLSDIKYKLTDIQKATPACALLCQLGAALEPEMLLRDKLKQIEYSECNIKIVVVTDDMCTVEIAENNTSNNFEKEHTQMIASSSLTSAATNKKQISGKSCPKKNNNPFTQNVTESLPTSHEKTSKNPFLQTSADANNKLTPEELDVLYDEPINTSNALKAVLGHDPQDDKRICRFYNPATGACFKGSNCKQDHVPFNSDGWTKDVLPAVSIIDNRSPQIVYSKGTILNITPTFIGQLGYFYAQINDAHHNNNPLIWNDEDIPPWKYLQRPPHVFELVLARYEDGLWYRAKVLTHDDDYRMFKVFYVDYGNHQIVDIKNLATCDYGMASPPFQAVLCRLGYLQEIEITEEKKKAGIKMLCDILLNKPLDVKVVTHHEDLIITIVGDLNLSIKSRLVHGGYMKPYKLISKYS